MKYKLMVVKHKTDTEKEVRGQRVANTFDIDKWISQKEKSSGGILWKENFTVRFKDDKKTYNWRNTETDEQAYRAEQVLSTDYKMEHRPAQYVIMNKEGQYARRYKHPTVYNSDDMGAVKDIKEAAVYPSKSDYSSDTCPTDREVYQFCSEATFVAVSVKVVRTIHVEKEVPRHETVAWRKEMYEYDFGRGLMNALAREIVIGKWISLEVDNEGKFLVNCTSTKREYLARKGKHYDDITEKGFALKDTLKSGFYLYQITKDLLTDSSEVYRQAYINEHYNNVWI